jgi:hypothetical protein
MRRIALLITVVALVVAVMLATSLSAGAKKRDPASVPAPAPEPAPAPDITEPVYTCAAIGCDPNFDWESFCALYPEECLNM